jgi:anti-sigma factor RsiW
MPGPALGKYVDGESAEDTRAAIERHLTECTRCVTESTRLQGLKNIVRHWSGVTGSGRFRAQVMQQMIRESQQTQIAPADLAEATAAHGSKQAQAVNADLAEPKRIPPVWV